ncbi:MAG TPA: acyltransferase [Acidimicrobiales bacterium]|jgi:peptidoglycan/LPS O-acetylase OafA/YrhL|nr:acyltransferase [Acidimicrobiales bacterium]
MIAVDPATASRTRDRFPCFDGLRAIAAGAVVVLHVSLISGFTFRDSNRFGQYFARGEAGVYLFFLISGYLLYRPFVAARFDERPGPGVRGYARRRALRILPAYWLALTVLVVVFDTRRRHDIGSVRDLVVYYGFLQIYFRSTVVGGLQQAWSLCTEVTFYVFLPIWAVLMRRRRADARPGWILCTELVGLAALFVVGVASRWMVVRGFPDANVPVDYRLDWLPMNADLFALGMGVAVLREWNLRRVRPTVALEAVGRHPGLCWIAAAVAYWAVSTQASLPLGPGANSPAQWMARQFLYAAAALFLLLPAVFGPQDRGFIRRLLRSRLMIAGGLISYGVYLWHEGVLDIWMHGRDIQPFLADFLPLLVVAVVGSIALATASYFAVERPALRLRSAVRTRA